MIFRFDSFSLKLFFYKTYIKLNNQTHIFKKQRTKQFFYTTPILLQILFHITFRITTFTTVTQTQRRNGELNHSKSFSQITALLYMQLWVSNKVAAFPSWSLNPLTLVVLPLDGYMSKFMHCHPNISFFTQKVSWVWLSGTIASLFRLLLFLYFSVVVLLQLDIVLTSCFYC